MIKKSLIFVAVLAVLLMGVSGALAVLPHSHGNDFNHANHPVCPIYQLGIHPFQSLLVAVVKIVFVLLITYLRQAEKYFFYLPSFKFGSLRAPPVSL